MRYFFILCCFLWVSVHAQGMFIPQYHTDINISSDGMLNGHERFTYQTNYNQNFMSPSGLYLKSNSPLATFFLPRNLYLLELNVLFDGSPATFRNENNEIYIETTAKKNNLYDFDVTYSHLFLGQTITDTIATARVWLFHSRDHLEVKHFEAQVTLPDTLNKNNVKLQINSLKAKISWISENSFRVTEDNALFWDTYFEIYFPKNAIGLGTAPVSSNTPLQLSKLNTSTEPVKPTTSTLDLLGETFTGVFHTPTKPKSANKKLYIPTTNVNALIAWNVVLLFGYTIFLYYLARSYGSFAALGSISIQYKAPKKMSLLQAGYLIDKKGSSENLLAAVLELQQMGYLQVMFENNAYLKNEIYLKRLQKDTDALSRDQHYLLEKILFDDIDIVPLDFAKHIYFSKLHTFESHIRDALKLKGLFYFSVKESRKWFAIKAYLTALPLLAFSIYTTLMIFGPQFTGIFLGFLLHIITQAISHIYDDNPFSGIMSYIMLLFFYMVLAPFWSVLFAGPALMLPFVVFAISYYVSKITLLTEEGLKAYKMLVGYKLFLERTELPALEAILRESPKDMPQSLHYALLFKLIKHPLM